MQCLGIARADFEGRTGVALSDKRLEGGRRATPFRPDEFARISEGLGVRLDYLIRGIEPIFETEVVAPGTDLAEAIHRHVVATLAARIGAAPEGVAPLVPDPCSLLAAIEDGVAAAFIESRANRVEGRAQVSAVTKAAVAAAIHGRSVVAYAPPTAEGFRELTRPLLEPIQAEKS